MQEWFLYPATYHLSYSKGQVLKLLRDKTCSLLPSGGFSSFQSWVCRLPDKKVGQRQKVFYCYIIFITDQKYSIDSVDAVFLVNYYCNWNMYTDIQRLIISKPVNCSLIETMMVTHLKILMENMVILCVSKLFNRLVWTWTNILGIMKL